ncbi:MAG: RluA family pseudouridine synthase [Candidatus Sericytochromatia bacterium]
MKNSFNNSNIELNNDLFEHFRFIIPEGQSLIRIDKYLKDKIQNATRHKVQQGIEKEYVLVNGLPVKVHYRVKPHDIITINLPEEVKDKTHYPENIDLDILYEDEYLVVVNKAAGMVVHPTFNNYEGTLFNALLFHFEHQGIKEKPFIVHRIDKETSGILVVAKTQEVAKELSTQFIYHTLTRTYYALVWGVFEEEDKKGTIRTFLDRSKQDRKLIQVYKNQGKEAITKYEIIEEYGKYLSLVKCNLETGRMHQIRVHMSYIGHPIFNDYFYGGSIIPKDFLEDIDAFVFDILSRQALHSKDITFYHPILKKNIFVDSELPSDFKKLIKYFTINY